MVEMGGILLDIYLMAGLLLLCIFYSMDLFVFAEAVAPFLKPELSKTGLCFLLLIPI